MKRILSLLLPVVLLFNLCGCGGKKPASDSVSITYASGQVASLSEQTPELNAYEVKITMDNLYDYFEYREFMNCVKSGAGDSDTGGSVESVQIAYGLALKDGYTAAADEKHLDTLQLTFEAEGVVRLGDFDIDYETLQYSGEVTSTEMVQISDTLSFWGKGNRTEWYQYGNYSKSCITYLRDFKITSAKGCIWLVSG